MPHPKVSIIMSVYNGERYLNQAIESIRRQTFENYEFIIIDDGSDDNSWDILSHYALKDPRIIILRNKDNIGITLSLAAGMKIAEGEYIARQDADDISLPNRLEKQKNHLDLHPETALVSCGLYMIDSKGNQIRRYDLDCNPVYIEWHLQFYNYLYGHSQVMFRRKTAERVGGYRAHFKYAQDYDLWTRLLNYGRINILPDKLLKYRCHSASISERKTISQLTFALEVAQRQLNKTTRNSFTRSDVEQLWSFWTVTELERIDITGDNQLARLNRNLALVLQGFEKQNKGLSPKDIIKIKKLIAERYVKWLVLILIGKYPKHTSVCMLLYALKWTGFRIFTIIAHIARQWHRKMIVHANNQCPV